MTVRTVATTESTEVCDWCDERLDKYDNYDAGFHEPIKASIVSGYISHPTNHPHVNKFYFLWKRKAKPEVRYDFHSRCFDEMVKVALANKVSKPTGEGENSDTQ